MNVGSLFSGIGGLDLGLHRAGWNHAFFCESDPYRRDVLRARFPGVPVYDDVRDVAREHRRPDVPDDGRGMGADGRAAEGRAVLGLLCGGFPCQDLSVAGKRKGLAGERSGLFHEFARIIEALRPRALLLENVPGLLSSNGGRDFGIVLGTLADLGYGVAWRIVDSRYFGVPQRRRRVFIVGVLADGDPRAAAERAGEILAVGTRCDRHPATRPEEGPDVAVASLSGLGSGGPDDNDGQAGRVIAVPLSHGSNPNSNMAGRRREDDENLTLNGAGVRRLTPTECERLQALPDGWTQLGGTPDSRRYAALGDAVTASVAEWIGRRLLA